MQIKAIRKNKKMSQIELASKAGITQAYLSALETGIKRNPSLKILDSIASALGVTLNELLFGTRRERDAS